VQKQFNTDHTIIIGDVIDNHYSSYHETDPDGYGAGEELRRAVDKLAKWHKAFPNAEVCIGNHDRMAARKVFTSGLSHLWLRDLNEVLRVPTWKFHISFVYDNVRYVHGDKGKTARSKCEKQSVVQGHRHSEGYVWLNAATGHFGMQVGCGVDMDSYAMAYAKEEISPALSCGVVLNSGTLPMIIPYKAI
jgi:hypothetical protein